jgi:outer membrane protein
MQLPFTARTLFQRSSVNLFLGMALAGSAQAQSLTEVFDLAKDYDAAYLSAKAQYQASLAKADQGKAVLLPTVGLSGSTSRTDLDITGLGAATRGYNTQTAGINATQPLYRPANLATYRQSQKALDAAQAALIQAEQDLIIRTSQAYFDVLGAQDSLTFVKAQKAAVGEQLASAKRNFEVGTATITDTREAQARFDLVTAQEIAADNDLRVKKVALEILVGKTGIQPKNFQAQVQLPPVPQGSVDTWVDTSAQNHPGIQQARTNFEVAKLETEKAQAGHQPTVDLTVGYNVQKNINGTATANLSGGSNQVNLASIGLTLNVPLFAGFATQNRIRETVALEEKARIDLEGVQRQVAQATRIAYFGLQSGLGQATALQAAESSSQVALDANKLGYQVGVRINIDVLNSQSQLFQTKRDLAKARYDVLLGRLKLSQAAGVLKLEDLQKTNDLLQK